MRKKCGIWIFVCLAALLLGILTGCGAEQPAGTKGESDMTNGVIQDSRIGAAGPFFYVPGDGSDTSVRKYNTVTHRVSRACPDADCDGKGLLDKFNIIVTYMSADDMQYYGVIPLLQGDGDTIHLIAQDIRTGELTEITTLSSAEQLPRSDVQVYDGTLYYMRKLLKEGGDRTNPEDYEPVIVSRPVREGRETVVYRLGADEGLRYVVKEGMILLTSQGVSLVDPATGARKDYAITEAQRTEWDITGMSGVHSCAYRDGMFLFRVSAGTPAATSELKPGYSVTGDYMMSLDLQTGKYSKLSNTQVYSMYLAADGLYYVPVEIRYLYVPEVVNDPDKDIVTTSFSGKLYHCDTDGKNASEVYSNDTIRFADPYCFAVVDGQMYGVISELNDRTHAFNQNTRFVQINLKTGNIIEFTEAGTDP
ncbi:MAG: hypothetical protein IKS35_00660 [Clostridia bacterium]|nr:hypothetical protein [Clostridia bacterium]